MAAPPECRQDGGVPRNAARMAAPPECRQDGGAPRNAARMAAQPGILRLIVFDIVTFARYGLSIDAGRRWFAGRQFNTFESLNQIA